MKIFISIMHVNVGIIILMHADQHAFAQSVLRLEEALYKMLEETDLNYFHV